MSASHGHSHRADFRNPYGTPMITPTKSSLAAWPISLTAGFLAYWIQQGLLWALLLLFNHYVQWGWLHSIMPILARGFAFIGSLYLFFALLNDDAIVVAPGNIGVPKIFGKLSKRFLTTAGNLWIPQTLGMEITAVAVSPQSIDVDVTKIMSKNGIEMIGGTSFLYHVYEPVGFIETTENEHEGIEAMMQDLIDAAIRSAVADLTDIELQEGKGHDLAKSELISKLYEYENTKPPLKDGAIDVTASIKISRLSIEIDLVLIKEFIVADETLRKARADREKDKINTTNFLLRVKDILKDLPNLTHKEASLMAWRAMGQPVNESYVHYTGLEDAKASVIVRDGK